ncbi:MAG: polyamine aminopropyltransferase, partial [Actinomycetota bacterium]
MKQTFGEPVTASYETLFRGELLWSGRSEFQEIAIYDHEWLGRTLTLDGTLQTSETDEWCYHEMLVHPALCSRSGSDRVLIIGGGDGGTLRHVLMHDPAHAVMCEIDGEVVRVSKEFLPSIAGDAFDDPRGEVVIGDGAAYVASHEATFDAVVVDSTDPVGAAEILFSIPFYQSCKKALTDGGVFVSQTGPPLYHPAEFAKAVKDLATVFRCVEVYLGFVPIYPGSLWSYVVATDGDPVSAVGAETVDARLRERSITTRYYNGGVHVGAFKL